jgi:hypothetical protein
MNRYNPATAKSNAIMPKPMTKPIEGVVGRVYILKGIVVAAERAIAVLAVEVAIGVCITAFCNAYAAMLILWSR